MDIYKERNVGIYVVHAMEGYERAGEYVVNLFEKHNINFMFVNESLLTTDIETAISKYFVPDIRNILNKGAISLSLNHILCYEQLVKDKYDYALIFEDDPYFLGDFDKDIVKVFDEMKNLPESFIISLENSTLEFPSPKIIRKNKYLYPATHGRCAGAYIIDLKAAINILNDLKIHSSDKISDWWHNDLSNRGVISHYWAHKPLVEQCSLNGMTSAVASSRTSSRKSGIRRRISWIAQKFYKTHIIRYFK